MAAAPSGIPPFLHRRRPIKRRIPGGLHRVDLAVERGVKGQRQRSASCSDTSGVAPTITMIGTAVAHNASRMLILQARDLTGAYFRSTRFTYSALSATLRKGSRVKLPPCSTKKCFRPASEASGQMRVKSIVPFPTSV